MSLKYDCKTIGLYRLLPTAANSQHNLEKRPRFQAILGDCWLNAVTVASQQTGNVDPIVL